MKAKPEKKDSDPVAMHIRMTRGLRDRIKKRAIDAKVTTNSFVVDTLAQAMQKGR